MTYKAQNWATMAATSLSAHARWKYLILFLSGIKWYSAKVASFSSRHSFTYYPRFAINVNNKVFLLREILHLLHYNEYQNISIIKIRLVCIACPNMPHRPSMLWYPMLALVRYVETCLGMLEHVKTCDASNLVGCTFSAHIF